MQVAKTSHPPGWAGTRLRPVPTVAALAAGVFVVGTLVAVARGTGLSYADEHEYLALGRHLAATGRYAVGTTPTAFRPPAWPVVVSLVDLLGGGVMGGRLVAVGCFTGAVVALYALARRIGGTEAGLLASAGLAVYPLSLYTSTTLYPEAMALLLVTVAVLATLVADDATGARQVGAATVAGGLFGLLALTASTYAVIVVPAAVWLLWRRFDRRRILALVVPLLLATAVLPTAWAVRNEARLGTFAPFTTNGGINLLLGNNPDATATTGVDADISSYEETARRRGLDEADRDHYYRGRAVDWIVHHPGRAAVLYVGKVANFFNFRNRLATENQQSAFTDAAGALSLYPLLLLFVVRLVGWRRWPAVRGEGLLVASYGCVALATAVFTTRIRYRVPVDQLLIAVVACGAVAWYRARGGSAGATKPAQVQM